MTDRGHGRRTLTIVLTIVFAANFLNYLDRQVTSALESEIRPAFGMSKAEFGYLWSAFTVGYMVFAPLVGFLADRHHRPRIFAVCVAVWSAATIGSGLVDAKAQLYAMRFLIGVGEAGCLVIGPTLLADYFSVGARGRAMSVFYLGMPLGGTAGYLVGGVMAQYFGGFAPAFFVAGAPGIGVAVALWLMHDPPRGTGGVDGQRSGGVRGYAALFRNRTLLLIVLAQAFAVVILAPVLHFSVQFFEQTHAMTKVQATSTLGAIALVAGVAGSALSGVIGDRLARRRKGAYALMAAVGYGVGMPGLMVGFQATSPWIYVPALTLGSGCLFLCMPAVNAQIANVVSARQRAMAYAFAVFVLHFLGDMTAPPVFGAVADAIGTGSAFFAFSFVLLGSSLCCLIASRTAARDVERFV